jgi:hypothetical protein
MIYIIHLVTSAIMDFQTPGKSLSLEHVGKWYGNLNPTEISILQGAELIYLAVFVAATTNDLAGFVTWLYIIISPTILLPHIWEKKQKKQQHHYKCGKIMFRKQQSEWLKKVTSFISQKKSPRQDPHCGERQDSGLKSPTLTTQPHRWPKRVLIFSLRSISTYKQIFLYVKLLLCINKYLM